MDYQKHYNALITRARCRVLECYSEKHHVVPKCIGGTDSASNIVSLTPEEHYIAHQLLCKIYPHEGKLAFALKMMTVSNQHQQRNNKTYGWVKRQWRRALSNNMKGKLVGEKNGMYNKRHTPEAIERMKVARSGGTITEEHKKAVSEASTGKTLSERHKRILSQIHTGKVVSEETRERLRNANLGRKMSIEWCKQNAENKRGAGNGMFKNGHKVSGEKNGMYGKSAIKGRKWYFNIAEQKPYLLSVNEIVLLDNTLWRLGRK